MKICAAQTKPVTGDIQSNIDGHKKVLDLAASCGAELLIFPELSLTGYEPQLAKELATNANDPRFDQFQKISDNRRITIGVGVPTRNKTGICISMVLFQPQAKRRIYSKKYLHPDEERFFTSGETFSGLTINETKIAFAICYEVSVPEHAENACKNGAELYIASVAKTENGVDRACKRLADMARRYSMTVFMSNCVGPCDGEDCGGKTSIWNNKGVLIGQLNETNEGILIFDTTSQEIIEHHIK